LTLQSNLGVGVPVAIAFYSKLQKNYL